MYIYIHTCHVDLYISICMYIYICVCLCLSNCQVWLTERALKQKSKVHCQKKRPATAEAPIARFNMF